MKCALLISGQPRSVLQSYENIFEKINSYTEEILEITDQDGNSAYNLKNGFVN